MELALGKFQGQEKKKTEDNKGAERNSLMIKIHQDKKQSSN